MQNHTAIIAQAGNTQSPTSPFGQGLVPPESGYTGEISKALTSGGDVGKATISTLELLISNAIGLITIAAGLFFILNFVTAGIDWITAEGDSGKIGKAREKIVQSVVGLVVTVVSYSLIGLAGSIVGFDILNPGAAILQLVPSQ